MLGKYHECLTVKQLGSNQKQPVPPVVAESDATNDGGNDRLMAPEEDYCDRCEWKMYKFGNCNCNDRPKLEKVQEGWQWKGKNGNVTPCRYFA
ncbi:hypothetical protein BLOT_012852 [Blomia tropicalis]|nr:hypothetical protein BLOT_012852 [Blomia tropicalis]